MTKRLVILLAFASCNKQSSTSPYKEELDFHAYAERDEATGDAKLKITTERWGNAEISVLGRNVKLPGGQNVQQIIPIPLAELKPGKNSYEVTAHFQNENVIADAKQTFEFDAYPNTPAIKWDKPAHYTMSSGTFDNPGAFGSLDDAGNFVATGTAPAGSKLSLDAGTVDIDATGKFTIKLPILAKLATRGLFDDKPLSYMLSTGVAGARPVSVYFSQPQVLQAVFLGALKKPVLFPGEAASTARATLWNIGDSVHPKYGSGKNVVDVDLVAVQSSKTRKLSNCVYTGNFVVVREAETVEVTVVDRRTAKIVVKKAFVSPDGESCPREIRAGMSQTGSAWRQGPKPETVDAFIAGQVSG